ncbi:D-isomer specific 2-hydroxyacid dehydrogenase family protein [Aspergillus saccharolyticus JOP 1030-1]|uniref:Glycerate dehydrogenase n=1 Tax=Aspergillus saccharolyticus JOP 1030-1 TaxID=1450539 RepID=A0A318ZNX8_9EURO|nr:glycerate dehydrogenase [Aspergillus saccharolyticus JOP 1030-1]PYH48355.1 glycerate dehydrogenase [Aspergillus saccharolyticus JOP 1030-1]
MAHISSTHHHIVYLQGDFVEILDFDLPAPHTYTKTIYPQTLLSEVHERIRDASVIVLSALRIDANALSPEVSPNLKLVMVVAVGTDCIDLEACRKRGIVVSYIPGANTESVSEHAIALHLAARRKIMGMNALTRAGEWPRRKTLMFDFLNKAGTPPLTCQEEVAGIIGNGAVGRRIAHLARGLGMKVIVADRKQFGEVKSTSNAADGIERVPFETVIQQSTALFVAVPLLDSTRNLISTAEFESMSAHAVLINVSRGGVIDESALVKALKEDRITGAATDVFFQEPASPDNSPLLAEGTAGLNLIVTPHLAWLAQRTMVNYSQRLKLSVEEWCKGNPLNVVT